MPKIQILTHKYVLFLFESDECWLSSESFVASLIFDLLFQVKYLIGKANHCLSSQAWVRFPLMKVLSWDLLFFAYYLFTTRLQFCRKTRQNAQSNNHESFFVLYKVLENHTVRNLHFLSQNSILISRENCRFFWGEKLVKLILA